MRYEYFYSEDYSEKLEEFLINNEISYKKKEYVKINGIDVRLYITIWSTDKNAEILIEQMKPFCQFGGPSWISAEYSEEDLDGAELLQIMPGRQVIDIINEDAYEYACEWTNPIGWKKARHASQKNLFVIRKEPKKKGQTLFWSPDTGFHEIFADRRIYELAAENQLTGIEFKNVRLKNGEFSNELYQMVSPNVLGRECIALGYGEKIIKCHLCGREQLVIDNTYRLPLDFSKIKQGEDFYMTERIFHEGIAEPLYIISQRFYQLLKKNKFIRNIRFIPVLDVSKEL